MSLTDDRYGALIAYNIWANRKTMAQIKELPQEEFVQELGGSFPSIQLTANHLLQSDWIWFNRWQQKPIVPVPATWDISTAESIDIIWRGIQDQLEALFDSLLPHSLDQLVKVETRRGDSFSLPLWQSINHSVNHGTYHRGQLTNMIRILGHKPIATDLFIFFNEQNSQHNLV